MPEPSRNHDFDPALAYTIESAAALGKENADAAKTPAKHRGEKSGLVAPNCQQSTRGGCETSLHRTHSPVETAFVDPARCRLETRYDHHRQDRPCHQEESKSAQPTLRRTWNRRPAAHQAFGMMFASHPLGPLQPSQKDRFSCSFALAVRKPLCTSRESTTCVLSRQGRQPRKGERRPWVRFRWSLGKYATGAQVTLLSSHSCQAPAPSFSCPTAELYRVDAHHEMKRECHRASYPRHIST